MVVKPEEVYNGRVDAVVLSRGLIRIVGYCVAVTAVDIL